MKIALSIVVALFLLGCSDDTTSSTQEKVLKHVSETSQEVKETVTQAVQDVKENVVETAKEVQEKSAEVVADVKEETQKAVAEVSEKVAPAPKQEVDAKKLFTSSCVSCHGVNAEKKALTKSQVIQGWDTSKTIAALEGYKNKTYGNSMKTIMEGKTKNLSDEEIKALADYISTL